tara:strand:- start:1133 stop:1813 length:681 start_codon:yes stop_codon:yes gene_type:complete
MKKIQLKKAYKEALEMLCSKEDPREFTHAPFLLEDKKQAFATDGFMIAIVNANKVTGSKDFRIEEKLDLTTIISPIRNKTIVIPLKDIKKDFAAAPQVELYDTIGNDVECETCEGGGEVLWEFEGHEKDDDCPVCSGQGLTTIAGKVKNGKTSVDRTTLVKIGDSHFYTNLILKLIDIIEKLGGEEIKLVSQTQEHAGSLFEVKDMEIVIMPCQVHKDVKIVASYV